MMMMILMVMMMMIIMIAFRSSMNLLDSFKKSIRAEKHTIKKLKSSNHEEQKEILINADRQCLSTLFSMCKRTLRAQNCCISEKQSDLLFKNQDILKDNFLGGHVRKKTKSDLVRALLNVSNVDNGEVFTTVLKCFH